MKITLIGSTRFIQLYEYYNKTLTLQGHLVYSVAMISTSKGEQSSDYDHWEIEDKMILDLVHLRKILDSDIAFLVTDDSGYYGDSTKREIAWARMLDKPVIKDLKEIPKMRDYFS